MRNQSTYTSFDIMHLLEIQRASIDEAIMRISNEKILTDDVKVEFFTPEAGWLDTSIIINQEIRLSFSFSDWNDSVTDLRDWLEDLFLKSSDKPYISCFLTDCERNNILLHIQSLVTYPDDICLFVCFNSWIDDNHDIQSEGGYAIVRKNYLIRSFYDPLISLFESLRNSEIADDIPFAFHRQIDDTLEEITDVPTMLEMLRIRGLE